MNSHQLNKCLFPLANYLKSEVRQIAEKLHLPVAKKKDSTGICFIGERQFQKFLANYLPVKPGNILTINTNRILGTHQGVHFYTIGQRHNIGITGAEKPYFVVKKDLKKNILYVGEANDKSRFTTTCHLADIYTILNASNEQTYECDVKFRYNQPLIKAQLVIAAHSAKLIYPPTIGVTPGQQAVIYQNNVCVASGVINFID